MFGNKVVWEGVVETFAIVGNSEAIYRWDAWSFLRCPDGKGARVCNGAGRAADRFTHRCRTGNSDRIGLEVGEVEVPPPT